MKKRLTISLLVVVLLMGAFLVWRIGYSVRKSNDNLPALTEIAKMSESEVNNILGDSRYQRGQYRYLENR